MIATTAAHDPARFRVPSNARVERFLPHSPILRRASVVVCHGGMGTTQKALAAGVPVCVVPFLRDQFEIARRVTVAGAGESLRASRLRHDRLRAAVAAAISRRPGAERVGRGLSGRGRLGPRRHRARTTVGALVEQVAEEPAVAVGLWALAGVGAEVAALGPDQALQLTPIEEDAVAGGALVDRDAIALVGAHRAPGT